MMYVSQINMLYTLNLYNAVCQLYLKKTGIKKKKIKYACVTEGTASQWGYYLTPHWLSAYGSYS